MSGSLFIESKTVRFGGVVPVIAQHLYLVYKNEKGQEYTIRGGPENEGDLSNFFQPGDISVQYDILLSASRDDRNSLSPSQRNQREIDLGDRNATAVWRILTQQARNIHNSDLDYELLSQNSNSTIASALNAVGINIAKAMPKGISTTLAPGVGNLLTFSTRLTGGDSHDFIVGGQSNDTVVGGGGDDILVGDNVRQSDGSSASRGADKLVGGAGGDVLIADHFSDAIAPNQRFASRLLFPGGNAPQSSYSGDEIIDLAIAQATFPNQLSAFLKQVLPTTIDPTRNQPSNPSLGLGNVLAGRLGDDVLVGGRAADRLDGNAGDDFLFAGLGDDTVVAGWGNDTVLGGAGNDTLYGKFNRNHMEGGPGNDKLVGGFSQGSSRGGDSLAGGLGNDTLDGNSGVDVAIVDPFIGKGSAPLHLGTDRTIDIELLRINTNDRPYRLTQKYSSDRARIIYGLSIGDKFVWRGIDLAGHVRKVVDLDNNPLVVEAQNIDIGL